MGKALYRKYRPKALAEIVGQEHITTTLGNVLKSGAISHAYLFTGPRGTGKTSIARILAHEVNGLPYDDEETSHLDIIEIDAASNRRIDEIRELRERVHTAPTSAKYKVYIIDEVHMLTREAFNALLKTLEEPPEHVIFILATTESHKLPDTIISRTQRFSFKPVEPKKVIDHLRTVAKSEAIDISDEALALIAEHGGGSFRDSISLLDQARSMGDTVDADAVRRSLGIAPAQAISDIWQALEAADVSKLIELLASLRGQGYQSGQLAKQLATRLREGIISGQAALSQTKLLKTLQQLLEVPLSHDTDTALEIVLIGLVLDDTTTPRSVPTVAPVPVTVPPPAPVAAPVEPATPEIIQDVTEVEPAPDIPVEISPAVVATPAPVTDDGLWNTILDAIKKRHNTLYGVLRMADVQFDGKTLTLGFSFAFHQKRMSETRNQQAVMEIAKQVSGQDITIICTLTSDAKKAPASPAKAAPAPLDTISNIFGGAEVIE